jgi:hypothetical protein
LPPSSSLKGSICVLPLSQSEIVNGAGKPSDPPFFYPTKSKARVREFVRQAWPIVESSTPFVPGWHIDAIIDHLETVSRGQIRNLLINVPPRHMKSLLVAVLWPAWEWIRFPERRWLYSSYAASLSIRDSVKCRRLIESPWYRGLWGDRFVLTGDQNTKGRFDNNRSGYRIATSVGGAATGEGGDRIVCDDPNNVNEVESDSVRRATNEWFDVVMSTRVNDDPKTTAKVVVMQRCHEQDLAGTCWIVEDGRICPCRPSMRAHAHSPRSVGPIHAPSLEN